MEPEFVVCELECPDSLKLKHEIDTFIITVIVLWDLSFLSYDNIKPPIETSAMYL